MTAVVLTESGRAVVLIPGGKSAGLSAGRVARMWMPLGRWPWVAAALVMPRLVWAVILLRPAAVRVSSIAYFGPAALAARWVIRRLGGRLVLVAQVLHVEEDGSMDSARGRLGRWADLAVLRRCDRVTVPSRATAAAVIQMLGDRAIPIAIITPGLAPCARRSGSDYAVESRPLRILFVGRLKTRKRPLEFARACALVARVRPIEVTVVGRGPQAPHMRAALVGIKVSFLHSLPDLSGVYSWADILVCTSSVEGFYFAGLEAMAAGVALLGYDVPAIRELAGDGLSARLVPAHEVVKLAESIICLDGRELSTLSAAGRDRAAVYSVERFSAAIDATILSPRWLGAECQE